MTNTEWRPNEISISYRSESTQNLAKSVLETRKSLKVLEERLMKECEDEVKIKFPFVQSVPQFKENFVFSLYDFSFIMAHLNGTIEEVSQRQLERDNSDASRKETSSTSSK